MSRRERQIMEILYQRGRASVAGVREAMADRPSYSAVRAELRILEEKGHARHHRDGARFQYYAAAPLKEARRGAVANLVKTFFGGSPAQAAVALIDLHKKDLTEADLKRLAEMVEQARKEGR